MSVDVSAFDELQIEARRIIDASEAPLAAADAADALLAAAPADVAAAPPPAASRRAGDSDDDDERCLQLEQMLADHAGAVAKSPHGAGSRGQPPEAVGARVFYNSSSRTPRSRSRTPARLGVA